MKKLYILLFTTFLLACNSKEQAQERPITPPNNNISVPKALQNYYKGFNFNKTGENLYNDLASLTTDKHTNVLGYKDRHKHLYKADASLKNPEYVVLVYTGEERYWKEYKSDSNDHKPQTFNTEHIFPQSKFSKEDTKSDLHHLKACDSKLNSSRGNIPFTNGSGKARRINNAWYPGDEWKGDVARMIMYVNLHYKDKIDNKIVIGGIETLLKWNDEDPVFDLERQRNNVIEQAQGNRNPFIDFPQLVRPAYKYYKE